MPGCNRIQNLGHGNTPNTGRVTPTGKSQTEPDLYPGFTRASISDSYQITPNWNYTEVNVYM